MIYIPTEWKTGDVVTAEKLNKLEDGVALASGGGGAFIITEDVETQTLDKTWKEIHDAMASGKLVLRIDIDDEFNAVYYNFVISVRSAINNYYVAFGFDGNETYITDTETGYPVLQEIETGE